VINKLVLAGFPGEHRGEKHPLLWNRMLACNPGDSLKCFCIPVVSGAAVGCGSGFIQLSMQDVIAEEKRRNPNTQRAYEYFRGTGAVGALTFVSFNIVAHYRAR
jgi:hypothetical protein